MAHSHSVCKGELKCYGTHAETRFRLSAKRASPFKSAEASVQSTTGSRGVRISGSNARYTMFRGSMKDTSYPLHSPVSSSLPLPCFTVCHYISAGVYLTVSFRIQVPTLFLSRDLWHCYYYSLNFWRYPVLVDTMLQNGRSRFRFPMLSFEFFIHSWRTMALGSTRPLIETNTSNISWRVKAASP